MSLSNIHKNAKTLEKFYSAFTNLDHLTMCNCYAVESVFNDEVFSLKGLSTYLSI
jgi:hypothetical protein